MSRILSLTFAGLATLAAPAFAGESTMAAPAQAVSLHDGALDMVVYYRPVAEGALEVTATYAPRDAGGAPARLVMAMREGDAVEFALPGHQGVSYAFARHENDVTVTTATGERTASAY